MPTDVTTVAETSAATTPVQYDSWDEKGTPIVTKKDPPKSEEPAASAASAKETTSEPKGETAAEPDAATSQEKKDRKPGDKLSAGEEIAKLRKELREATDRLKERERSREPEPKPAKSEAEKPKDPATYTDWRKAFKPKEWIEQWAKDNPSGSYEDAVAAMGDHQADIRDSYRQLEIAQQRGRERSSEMLKKTIEKYPDAEDKVKLTAKSLMQPEVPNFVRALIDDSEVMTDLLYTLSDAKTLENFLDTAKSSPGKAIRALRDMELGIQKAIAKPAAKEPEKSEREETPADPKPRAPKPPSEVGGRGTGTEDAAVAAARSGNFRAFEAEQNRLMQARFSK